MNNPTDDQEDRRLREVVVEAALALGDSGCAEDDEALQIALSCSTVALRDHRAKVAGPEVVLRCEPPGGKDGIYWLENADGAERFNKGWSHIQPWDFEDGLWHDMYGNRLTPESQHNDGWSYLEPAVYRPATPNRDDIRREPTDEAILDYAIKSDWLGTAHLPRIRQLIAHFHAAPAKPQATISDEEIDTLAALNCNFWVDRKIPWLGSFEGFAFRRRQVRAFARTLLAKHSGASTLSDETLRELWHLARQDALDQFVTEAKPIVAGRS